VSEWELAAVHITQNDVKLIKLRRMHSWEEPKLLIYPSAEGMVCLYWGRPVTTVPQNRLEDVYYAAIAYTTMQGTCEGFPTQLLDVSNSGSE
jgi:hypothetical protein